jgi:probable rRNA maturation factor
VNDSIHFFSEGITFQLESKGEIRIWLKKVVQSEMKKPGEINFIFCNDDYLFNLNKTFLKHNTYTDIITFPATEQPTEVAGDIFISIPRIIENAVKYNQSFNKEIRRVMVHGILHLIGYMDKTKSEKREMVSKENEYLDFYFLKL